MEPCYFFENARAQGDVGALPEGLDDGEPEGADPHVVLDLVAAPLPLGPRGPDDP